MKHNAYIFDFDGVLVDSMPDWSGKMINILETYNVDYPADIIKIITPLGDKGTADYFIEKLNVPLSVEEMITMMDEYAIPKYRDEIEAKPGVIDYLNRMKKEGISLNVLTASPHKMVDVCLKRLGVFDLFDNVWSCDDFNTTKKDPEIYKAAVEKIGSTIKGTVFFDDNINAVKTAKQAGLFVVGVYDESGEEFKDSLKEISDLYIDTFEGEKRI